MLLQHRNSTLAPLYGLRLSCTNSRYESTRGFLPHFMDLLISNYFLFLTAKISV